MSFITKLQDLGIDLRKKTSGSIKTTCPKCSEGRGKNRKDPCLSVDIDAGLWNCHHCQYAGKLVDKLKKEYVVPPPRLEKLSPKSLSYFENTRKISNNTLLRFNITEAMEYMPQHQKEVKSVCFNYYRGEQLVNIKFRGPQKSFKLQKDAELIFYNLNALQGQEEAVIAEGEIDCLSFHEAGVYNSVSVPNGASKGSMKLEYLDNCWEWFSGFTKIILATDNDEAGKALREELARRLGKERCFMVNYPDGCKDANEVLCKYGADAVKNLVLTSYQWPLEGVVGMEDMVDEISGWYDHGYPKGDRSGVKGLDELLLFSPGELTMITGIPGHGKDEYANFIMTSLAKNCGWRWGGWGFEEKPPISATKIMEKHAGKSFEFRKNKESRMNQDEFEKGILFVDEHFSFINVRQVDVTMTGIIKKAEELVRRKGIKGIIINPWNYIEHKIPVGSNETLYTSAALSELTAFLEEYGVHGFMIAHPTKMYKDPKTGKYSIPTLYSISGSAHFYNKTYNGISVYRDTDTVEIYIQKVKQHWNGMQGWISYKFNTDTRQYEFLQSSFYEKNEQPTEYRNISINADESDSEKEENTLF